MFGNIATFTVLVLKLVGSYSHYVYNELLVTLTKIVLWNDWLNSVLKARV